MIKTFQQTLNSKLVARPLQLAFLALIIMNLSGECLGICDITTNNGTYSFQDKFCEHHILTNIHSSKTENVASTHQGTVNISGFGYNYDFTTSAK